MTSAYDIGVGRCCAIGDGVVLVMIDSVIAKRLLPDEPWRRSGTSVLRCDRKACSQRRPPVVNEELYLDSAALARHASAALDLLGNGDFQPVDLKAILIGLKPLPAPPAVSKKTAFIRRGK